MRYDPAAIEPKWQQVWEERQVFRAPTDPRALSVNPTAINHSARLPVLCYMSSNEWVGIRTINRIVIPNRSPILQFVSD